jgi:uncharacterized protein (TIGR03435 family)
MQTPQILAPAWFLTEIFDVDAKLPEGASAELVPAMLRELLAKRFEFAAHMEQREVSGFALVIGKGGSKLAPPQDGWDASWRQNKTGIHLRQRMSMDDLAYYLSTQLEKPVVNQTGLQGIFAVALDFGPLTLSSPKKVNIASPLPLAVEEQLGLR